MPHDVLNTRAAGASTMRRATPTDWDAIARLIAHAGLPLDGAASHVDDFTLIERDGHVIGCVALERYGTVALLRSLAVDHAMRGERLGVALVERAIAHARADEIETLVLLTTTAAQFFPRFGFHVATRDDVPRAVHASEEFRGACPASATVMRLDLGESRATRASSVHVRAATEADATAIAAIYNESIRDRVATFETRERTPDDVRAWFADLRHPRLVAERDGQVVGWITASSYRPRDCYAGIAEFSVYVASAARGQGVGDALMAAFVPACEAVGFWKVLSRIFPENGASRALCARHGFREVGTYEKHAKLDGLWRDVVIVERILSSEAAR